MQFTPNDLSQTQSHVFQPYGMLLGRGSELVGRSAMFHALDRSSSSSQ